VLARWYARHDAAYYTELARWFPELAPPAGHAPERMLEHWNHALRSDAGEACVARVFAERMARASGV
jgi:hypothetical protein